MDFGVKYAEINKDSKRDEKRRGILDKLKSKPFATQKGSSLLMEKLKVQRQSLMKTIDVVQEDQVIQLLAKQQNLVIQLNEENTEIIKDNKVLKDRLTASEREVSRLQHVNSELSRENLKLKRK